VARNKGPIVFKNRVENSANVFDNHGAWLNLVNNAQRRGEKITLVEVAQLFAGFGKWRARKAGRNDIDTPTKLAGVKVIQILLDHIPFGPIESKSLTSVRIEFYEADMVETGLFEAQSLAARASAQFKNRNRMHIYNCASKVAPLSAWTLLNAARISRNDLMQRIRPFSEQEFGEVLRVAPCHKALLIEFFSRL